ncbi:hypothetical protein LTR34_008701 [Exophiala xenobiotica]|nr:hypothetical protein LTR34_008701 [Exophiala xenobiotica]
MATLGSEVMQTELKVPSDESQNQTDYHFGLTSPWETYYRPSNTAPQGRFECELDELIVFGEIPKQISGTWYRMMIDPHFCPLPNTPFIDGDGHVCAFRIEDGRVSMKIKYVHTERWLLERKAGRRLFGRYRNPYDTHPCVRLANDSTGNTNIIYWGGNLLALAERGLPHSMDPDTLETRSSDPYTGQVAAKTFTAHPKVDPHKNELVAWSYSAKGLKTPDICTYAIDPDGRISNVFWYQQDKPGWPHDGWITDHWIILSNMPYENNDEAVLKAGGDYWRFVPGQPSELLVSPRYADSPSHPNWKPGEFRKYTAPHGLIIHTGNAWEEEGGILKLESHFVTFNVFEFFSPKDYKETAKPSGDWVRWTLDLSKPDGTALPLRETLLEGIFDFPIYDHRLTGRPSKILYVGGMMSPEERGQPIFNAVIKLNTETLEKSIFYAPGDGSVAEPAYIPRGPDGEEGDGWIIFYTDRPSSNKGELIILDTNDFSKPVAIAQLPFQTKNQVHGNWVENPHPGKPLPFLTGPVRQDVKPTARLSQLTKIPLAKLTYIDETAELTAIYDQNGHKADADEEHHLQQHQEWASPPGLTIEPQPESEDVSGSDGAQEDFQPQSASEYAVRQAVFPVEPTTNPGDQVDDQAPVDFHHVTAASFDTTEAISARSASLGGLPQGANTLWQSPSETRNVFAQTPQSQGGLSWGSQIFPSPNTARNTGSSFVSTLVKPPTNPTFQSTDSRLEVVLLRYFIDVLARWFDICDPERHFADIVPHRARWCPPLKNAVLAASARHLTRVQRSGAGHVYYYDGEIVPDLNDETALHYHNECIRDLLTRSMDPDQTRDASLLAAAIVLRFYEEIDAPLREEERDSELFLRVMNVFIDAQIPAVPLVPHSSPVITGPKIGPADRHTNNVAVPSPEAMQSPTAASGARVASRRPRSEWPAEGLCQAAFWVAFRQEIHSAFLKQRAVNLALSRCEAFRSFSPAEDAVWADRLIIFCADVLEFCYGNSTNAPTRPQHDSSTATPKDRWLSLKQYERMWSEVLPASFEPIYFRDPDRAKGEVFPQIYYMADCHVAGVQHVELARILLAVYDPTAPKLGPGYLASVRKLSMELKNAVLRLCGIAVSNRKCPPAMVTAFLGIAMCGDHFEDPIEQQALLGMLDEMEAGNAWPAGNVRQTLREAWGQAS